MGTFHSRPFNLLYGVIPSWGAPLWNKLCTVDACSINHISMGSSPLNSIFAWISKSALIVLALISISCTALSISPFDLDSPFGEYSIEQSPIHFSRTFWFNALIGDSWSHRRLMRRYPRNRRSFDIASDGYSSTFPFVGTGCAKMHFDVRSFMISVGRDESATFPAPKNA